MARTAVVSGTATAVSNRVSRRQAERWAAEAQPYPQEQYDAPAPAAAPAAPTEDRVQALKDLAGLKAQGVLTEEEFEREKARVLGS